MTVPDRPVVLRRCPRCGHPTRADRMVKGFGRDCAAQLGLIGRSVDTGHDGPDLLDELRAVTASSEEEDSCDGWDRPGDGPYGW
jgi:hypothetical protein